jgi:hypothetical protein
MILVIVRFSSEGLDDLGENTNDLRLTCGSYECAENTNDPSARHTAWRHGVTIGMQLYAGAMGVSNFHTTDSAAF